MSGKAGRAALVVIGAGASAALAGLAFFRLELAAGAFRIVPRFDFGAWAARLPSHWPWLVPFVALVATLSALRVAVWGRTLPPPAPRRRVRFHALALGALAHNALPGHLGAPAAAWVLHRCAGTPFGAALSSLLAAKLLEFGALFGATAVLAAAARRRGAEGAPPAGMLWAGLIALTVFSSALVATRSFAPRLGARLGAGGRRPRLAAALGSVAEGLTAVGSPRRLLAGAALALGPVLASALAYGLALRHMGVASFLLGGGLLVGALSLAQITPGLPSVVGIYYLVCSATARALGVDDHAAAALALLSHTASVATHILVGLVVALAYHDRLRDVLRLPAAFRRPRTLTSS